MENHETWDPIDKLDQPRHWRKARFILVNDMKDIFDLSFEEIDDIFTVMGLAPQHKYLILTKRPDRMTTFFQAIVSEEPTANTLGLVIRRVYILAKEEPLWPLRNIWFGVSAESQEQAVKLIPDLLKLKKQGHISKVFVSDGVEHKEFA